MLLNLNQQIQVATDPSTEEITHFSEKEQPPTPKPTVEFPISSVDFDRVQTPFIIGIWILSASVAKIGKYSFVLLHHYQCYYLR